MSSATAKKKRPFGVTVIVILQVVNLVLLIITVAFYDYWLVKLSVTFTQSTPLTTQLITNVYSNIAVDILIIAYMIIVSYGFWHLNRWAWFLTMIQMGISLFINLWRYFNGTSNYLAMTILIVMVFYLNQREVQQAFEHTRKNASMLP